MILLVDLSALNLVPELNKYLSLNTCGPSEAPGLEVVSVRAAPTALFVSDMPDARSTIVTLSLPIMTDPAVSESTRAMRKRERAVVERIT